MLRLRGFESPYPYVKDSFKIMVDGDGISEYAIVDVAYDPTMHASGLWIQYRASASGAWQYLRVPSDVSSVWFEVNPKS